jgi:hypothetical protein
VASQTVTLRAAGLQTYFQSLMELPPGALLKANNTVIDRDGVIEPRRGFKAYGLAFGTQTDRAKQLMEYKGRILRHVGNKLAYDNGSAVFTDFSGTYLEPVSGYRIRSLEAKSNFYFTTNAGVKKISAASAADLSIPNVIQDAGAPKAVTGLTTVNYSVAGFLSANSKVAYKVMWVYTDRNQNLLFGSPSARMVASNPTALNDASVNLTFQIPSSVTSSDYKYRIFRSEIASGEPSDELYQIFEGTPTPAQLSSRVVDHVDSVAEEFRIAGVPLYTNQFSGDGALSANEPPPSARDVALFKGHMFYGNTRNYHSTFISLIDVAGITSGVSTLVVSDGATTNTYTFYGAKEKTDITVTLPHASIIPSSFFLASSASNERRYKIWLDKTGSDPEPTAVGTIPVRVDLSGPGISTPTQVAAKIVSDINTNASIDFVASNVGAVITIENTNNGISSNGVLEGVIDITTTFTFSTTQQGEGEDLPNKKILISAKVNLDEAIEQTAQSIVRNINAQAGEIVTAFYASNFGEVPGKMYLQRKTLENISFYVGTNDAAIVGNFNPSLGTGPTLATKVVSTAETVGNRLYWSKYQENEAVPILNFIDVGARDQEILRIISLRESLFILKGDGVFRLAGEPGDQATWDVSAFDNTSIIKAPDTAVTLGNQCYYFSNRGIDRLNESALESVSLEISDKFLPFISTNSSLKTASFAVGYESDRALLVWTVKTKLDTVATVCYRYNIITGKWTEWEISKTCAVLNVPQDKLYLGSGVDNYVEQERKNFDRFDYADRELTINLSAGGLNDKLIKPSGFSDIAVQDVILQTQYVTIYQFNALLQKIDLDNGIPSNDYYSTLKMVAGDNLTSKMTQLVAKLNVDDPVPVYTFSGTTSFATIQTEFNVIINKLNASPTTFFENYNTSVGTISYEAIVLALDTISKQVTLNIAPAFMIGPMTLYKGIKTEVEYAPQHAGEPASHKQFSTGTFMFERRSFYTAQVAYNSDISDNYEEITFVPNSAGIFGGANWGDGTIWGGQGDQSQIRTYVPLKKQRCRFLGCKFIHGVALESYELYGLALSVRGYSIPDRNYK